MSLPLVCPRNSQYPKQNQSLRCTKERPIPSALSALSKTAAKPTHKQISNLRSSDPILRSSDPTVIKRPYTAGGQVFHLLNAMKDEIHVLTDALSQRTHFLLEECKKKGNLTQDQQSIEELKKHVSFLHDQASNLTTIQEISFKSDRSNERKFNLKEKINPIIAKFKTAFSEKNISFVCELPPELDRNIFGDAYNFKQILRNLLQGFLSRSEQGHVVTLTITCEEKVAFYRTHFQAICPQLSLENREKEIFDSPVLTAQRSHGYHSESLSWRNWKRKLMHMSYNAEIESNQKGCCLSFTINWIKNFKQFERPEKPKIMTAKRRASFAELSNPPLLIKTKKSAASINSQGDLKNKGDSLILDGSGYDKMTNKDHQNKPLGQSTEIILKEIKNKAQQLTDLSHDDPKMVELLANLQHDFRTPLNAILHSCDSLLETPSAFTTTYSENISAIKTVCSMLLDILIDIAEKMYHPTTDKSAFPSSKPFELRNKIEQLIHEINKNHAKKFVKFEIDSSIPDYDFKQLLWSDKKLILCAINILLSLVIKNREDDDPAKFLINIASHESDEDILEAHCTLISSNNIFLKDKSKEKAPKSRIAQRRSSISKTTVYEDFDTAVSYIDISLGGTLQLNEKAISFMIPLAKNRKAAVHTLQKKVMSNYSQSERVKKPCTRLHTIRERVRIKSILVVEDNEINFKVIYRYLKQWSENLSIERAETGAAAVDLTQQCKFDLILMDINLSNEMNGIEAAQKIRAQGSPSTIEKTNVTAQDVLIFAVTACVTDETKQECTAVGMVEFIGKPAKKNTVIDAINRWGYAPFANTN